VELVSYVPEKLESQEIESSLGSNPKNTLIYGDDALSGRDLSGLRFLRYPHNDISDAVPPERATVDICTLRYGSIGLRAAPMEKPSLFSVEKILVKKNVSKLTVAGPSISDQMLHKAKSLLWWQCV
jgi:hypothetical protein